jgi:hypothetical protein
VLKAILKVRMGALVVVHMVQPASVTVFFENCILETNCVDRVMRNNFAAP